MTARDALRFGSLFSGIEAASAAWETLGWQCRWVAEIDPFACAVLAHHYPGVPNLGDVERIDPDAVEPVDLVIFGSPCQSFSVAGKRLGLDDPRGNLALVGLRLVSRIRPRWVVWENVPGVLSSGGGRDFGAFLGLLGECGYGFAYSVLDAQHFGVPQRRRRVFVVGYLGDWRPPAAVLFEQSCLHWNPAPRAEAGQGVARPVASSPEGCGGYRNDADTADKLIPIPIQHYSGCQGQGGAGIGLGGEPMFTINAQDRHAVAFNNTGQGRWNEADAAASVRKGNDNGYGGARESTLIAFQADAGRDFTIDADRSPPLRSEGIGGMSGVAIAYGGSRQSGRIDVAAAGNAHGGPHGRPDFETETFVVPLTLAIRGRGDSHDLEWRDDGTPNAILTPNGGRSGTGVGALAAPVTAPGFIHPRLLRNSQSSNQVGIKPQAPVSDALTQEDPGAVMQGTSVRRLTPVECERLQGFPDGYTDIRYRGKPAADGPRYRAIGNSMAVPVIRWLGRRIAAAGARPAA